MPKIIETTSKPGHRVGLEAFSNLPIRALKQAFALRVLTRENHAWLRDTRPEVITQYAGHVLTGAAHVRTAAVSEDVASYLIRHNRRPVGMARIIRDQTISLHGQPLTAQSLDYWTNRQLDPDVHQMIGERIYNAACELEHEAEAFVSVVPTQGLPYRRPIGLFMTMREGSMQLGVHLDTPEPGADPYDISHDGKQVDVFTTIPHWPPQPTTV